MTKFDFVIFAAYFFLSKACLNHIHIVFEALQHHNQTKNKRKICIDILKNSSYGRLMDVKWISFACLFVLRLDHVNDNDGDRIFLGCSQVTLPFKHVVLVRLICLFARVSKIASCKYMCLHYYSWYLWSSLLRKPPKKPESFLSLIV